MKNSNSYYTSKNSRIMGNEKIKNIAINAILIESYKEKKNIFQPAYTAQNRCISRIGLRYIHGYVALEC